MSKLPNTYTPEYVENVRSAYSLPPGEYMAKCREGEVGITSTGSYISMTLVWEILPPSEYALTRIRDHIILAVNPDAVEKPDTDKAKRIINIGDNKIKALLSSIRPAIKGDFEDTDQIIDAVSHIRVEDDKKDSRFQRITYLPREQTQGTQTSVNASTQPTPPLVSSSTPQAQTSVSPAPPELRIGKAPVAPTVHPSPSPSFDITDDDIPF